MADLAAFVIASPSSFHAAAEAARRLAEAGFAEQDEAADWDSSAGGHYLVRDGALVAWRLPDDADPRTPFRIVGAHTDSPGFAVKPNPDLDGFGYAQLGLEVYGGPLLNSWLDRELGLAGRVVLTDGRTELVRTDAIMRIPQLAIHLDRGVNDNGLKLDKQHHTMPVWGVGRPDRRLADHLGGLVGCRGDQIDGFDLVAYDATRARRLRPRRRVPGRRPAGQPHRRARRPDCPAPLLRGRADRGAGGVRPRGAGQRVPEWGVRSVAGRRARPDLPAPAA